jgi:catechol 2,3-dioxygenase-like lactoylglutathione lyase family enzyme
MQNDRCVRKRWGSLVRRPGRAAVCLDSAAPQFSPSPGWNIERAERSHMAEYRCDHVHLRSADAESAARFYTDMFGAQPVFRRMVDGMLRIALDLSGLTLFIDQVPAGTPTAPRPPFIGIEHICLAVKGLDEAAAELRRKGVAFVVEPRELRPGVRYAFIEAPDGIRLELIDRSGA